MNKVQCVLILALFLSLTGQSQKNALVHYQEIRTLDLQLPDDLDEEIRSKIPDQQVYFFDLFCMNAESLYTNAESDESPDIDISSGDEHEQFQFKISAPKYTVYSNRMDNEYLCSQNFMGKQFLIEDENENNKWKITAEQKTVLGIPCIKAITDNEIEAWFAPSIAISFGPNGYGGLPGLILALTVPEDNREIIAISIEENKVKSSDLKRPTKGKKVTRSKFEGIVEDKMKEMGAEGNGGVRIITIEEEN